MSTVLPPVHGRINDLDAHLQAPASRWGEVFGEATAELGKPFLGTPFFDDTNTPELSVDSA